MKAEAKRLREIIEKARPQLERIDEERASVKQKEDQWSIKEITGHLIDSAANNQQRFVRLQNADETVSIRYDQEFWVKSQAYQGEKWGDLIELWYFYNKHLSHIMENLNPSTLDNKCDIGYPEMVPLSFVVKDYLRHLEHHLKQIEQISNGVEL